MLTMLPLVVMVVAGMGRMDWVVVTTVPKLSDVDVKLFVQIMFWTSTYWQKVTKAPIAESSISGIALHKGGALARNPSRERTFRHPSAPQLLLLYSTVTRTPFSKCIVWFSRLNPIVMLCSDLQNSIDKEGRETTGFTSVRSRPIAAGAVCNSGRGVLGCPFRIRVSMAATLGYCIVHHLLSLATRPP